MISKMLHSLSKKASRKNLYNFIKSSFDEKIKIKEINVLNIGSGGELESLIKKNFKNVFSIDIDD